ncbi:hypothetical protein EDD18DRAFT_168649 [Armillaria luteobubalina]|uniref:Uncharacterized protein n=1 Tax=Armillaria luteobubalina TaxID=153913 RepID=A0AA39P2V1_9AGAR|nr:hypothetical protein EDD18DRAFT_168649 [Armillaria luteobubalina]
MQILILIFLLTVGVTGAPDNDSSGLPACSKEPRTELSIIWSCLATIFASTWLAVHPNVPGFNLTKEGSIWGIFDRPTIMCSLERLKLMLIAILAPEFMVGWAIRQFLVARKVRAYSSKDHELKLVHGFFVSMGGFYYGKEKRIVTLTDVPKVLELLAKVRAVDIKDKSKGDALSKIILILQLSWFVVQCCARVILKLPITLLEISTLAFAVQSVVSYIAWWEKPVDVRYHIRLEEHSSMDTDQDASDVSPDVDMEPKAALSPARRSLNNPDTSPGDNDSNLIELLPFSITASFNPTIGYNVDSPHNSPAIDPSAESSSGRGGYIQLGSIQDRSEVAECLRESENHLYTRIYISIMEVIFGDDLGSGIDRPPATAATGTAGMSCCGGGTSTETVGLMVRVRAVVCVGWLFGAVHCAAWSFNFPSPAEMILWRTSSIAIVICLIYSISHLRIVESGLNRISQWVRKVFEPSRILLARLFPRNKFELIYIFLDTINVSSGIFHPFKQVSSSLSVLAIMMYIIARAILIVLAFLQLRSLPPLALRTVNWTTLIPHII